VRITKRAIKIITLLLGITLFPTPSLNDFSSSGFRLPDQKTDPPNPHQKIDGLKSLANEQVYSSNIISPEGLEHGNRHANGRDRPLLTIFIKTALSKD
jgi:hypothetical protein